MVLVSELARRVVVLEVTLPGKTRLSRHLRRGYDAERAEILDDPRLH